MTDMVRVPAEKIAALREAFVQRDDVTASQRNANVWNAAVHLVGWLDDHAAHMAAPDELTALRAAQAQAWDEGYAEGIIHMGMNPYRSETHHTRNSSQT